MKYCATGAIAMSTHLSSGIEYPANTCLIIHSLWLPKSLLHAARSALTPVIGRFRPMVHAKRSQPNPPYDVAVNGKVNPVPEIDRTTELRRNRYPSHRCTRGILWRRRWVNCSGAMAMNTIPLAK